MSESPAKVKRPRGRPPAPADKRLIHIGARISPATKEYLISLNQASLGRAIEKLASLARGPASE